MRGGFETRLLKLWLVHWRRTRVWPAGGGKQGEHGEHWEEGNWEELDWRGATIVNLAMIGSLAMVTWPSNPP